jgi:hypothetical protein
MSRGICGLFKISLGKICLEVLLTPAPFPGVFLRLARGVRQPVAISTVGRAALVAFRRADLLRVQFVAHFRAESFSCYACWDFVRSQLRQFGGLAGFGREATSLLGTDRPVLVEPYFGHELGEAGVGADRIGHGIDV